MIGRAACFAASVAAALAAAACSGQDQRSVSTAAQDAYLTAAVTAKLAAVDVDAATSVHVSTAGGVVTLRGQAHTASERSRYDEAAKSVSGVASVRDALSVNPHLESLRNNVNDAQLAARVSAAIASQAGVNVFHVTPAVHEGVVTLSGTVSGRSVRDTILSSVRGVPGVRRVVNRMRIR